MPIREVQGQGPGLEGAPRALRGLLREKAEAERGAQRRSLRGRGNRNERIRTYNFPQDRCTDHRVGVTVPGLPQLFEGQLDSLLEQLIEKDKEESLNNL